METSPRSAGFDAARLDRITAHIERNYIDPGKIAGCQVLVARHGIPAYFRSFGLMDRERNRPMRDDAIFRIYSMTKPITSIALMQQFEEARFMLNDPVARYLPGWERLRTWVSGDGDEMQTKEPARPVTFKHVLSHTAGLTYGATNHPVDKAYRRLGIQRGPGETLDTFVEKLGQAPLRYDPGERWMYSFATDVCGALVERISGKRLDQYFRERIFEPLGMVDTAFRVPAEKRDRFAANYQRQPDKSLRLIDDPETSAYLREPAFLSGGGGLVGTIHDYWRFCEMLRRGGELDGERVIGSRTLELMTRNHLPGGQDLTAVAIGAFSETANEGVGFGLGFAVTLDAARAGTLGEGDYYWGGAASTIFWVDPREDLVCIFMTQLMPSGTFNFRGQLKNLIYSAIEG